MFDDFGRTTYILNQIIFFILVALFYWIGLKVAKKNIQNKKRNKRGYYSVTLSSPVGFIVAFFVIDSVAAITDKYSTYSLPYSIIAYWVTVASVGIVLSAFFSFFVIKQELRKERNSQPP